MTPVPWTPRARRLGRVAADVVTVVGGAVFVIAVVLACFVPVYLIGGL